MPTLALTGLVQNGVDVLDVPGLGTRRIVLRRFDRRRSASLPVDTVARLLRESAAAFDTRSTSWAVVYVSGITRTNRQRAAISGRLIQA